MLFSGSISGFTGIGQPNLAGAKSVASLLERNQ